MGLGCVPLIGTERDYQCMIRPVVSINVNDDRCEMTLETKENGNKKVNLNFKEMIS